MIRFATRFSSGRNAAAPALAALLIAFASGAALAEDAAPKTRAQVRAELIEARAQGSLPMGGEFAGTMRHDGGASAADRQETRTATREPKRAEPHASAATGG